MHDNIGSAPLILPVELFPETNNTPMQAERGAANTPVSFLAAEEWRRVVQILSRLKKAPSIDEINKMKRDFPSIYDQNWKIFKLTRDCRLLADDFFGGEHWRPAIPSGAPESKPIHVRTIQLVETMGSVAETFAGRLTSIGEKIMNSSDKDSPRLLTEALTEAGSTMNSLNTVAVNINRDCQKLLQQTIVFEEKISDMTRFAKSLREGYTINAIQSDLMEMARYLSRHSGLRHFADRVMQLYSEVNSNIEPIIRDWKVFKDALQRLESGWLSMDGRLGALRKKLDAKEIASAGEFMQMVNISVICDQLRSLAAHAREFLNVQK